MEKLKKHFYFGLHSTGIRFIFFFSSVSFSLVVFFANRLCAREGHSPTAIAYLQANVHNAKKKYNLQDRFRRVIFERLCAALFAPATMIVSSSFGFNAHRFLASHCNLHAQQ